MNTNSRITIKDVAEKAGVSTQTVSRVINERPDVARETRQKVLAVIEELGYRPSALARGLIRGRSYTLGVVTAGLKFVGPSRTLNGIATKANDVLSGIDKQFIAGAKMYPKAAPTVVDATPLEVNARRRTQASIGKFGEEDLFTFQADTAGRHVVDTRGPTDVVMKLFGPDSTTALIAEDDDSGVNLNARIVRDLVPGRYYVQVRHWNLAGGTGDYTIRVHRA